jgi:hypothetical protein
MSLDLVTIAKRTMPPVQSSAFCSLAPEVVERIVLNCHDPLDVHRLASTCALLHRLVYASPDRYLWREHYLRLFDDPRLRCPRMVSYDWRGNLQKRIAAREDLKRTMLNVTETHGIPSNHAMRTLVEIVQHAAPSSGQTSESLSWLSEQLDPILKDASWCSMPWLILPEYMSESFRLRSRLLVYCGLKSESLSSELRTNARVAVYCTITYRESSTYGPFMPDTSWRVNWFALYQNMVVILMNLEENLHMFPADAQPPTGLEATRPCFWKPQAEDWAGISGNWRHVPSCASNKTQSC